MPTSSSVPFEMHAGLCNKLCNKPTAPELCRTTSGSQAPAWGVRAETTVARSENYGARSTSTVYRATRPSA
ncbi:hypothetical protein CERZMDRAFT_120521 [Cercospora zeae-maydis SCOH1-5]|uniref:Uncharacterized protein n=1 Tax=Cercospora zeae-maydis SCOH1-5 TaxID=717836 RepID=A0A6A6FL55_9PEZI|nr:hypothetical protein CERZMDRAFT_120521 [Cercospora zeae-maydis SCOH1-5]